METLRNKNPKNLSNTKEELRFQVIDWKCYNETIDDDDDEEAQSEDNAKYVIQMFGVTESNESISVKVTGFKPRFYVNIPKDWSDIKLRVFIDAIKKKVKKRYRDSIVQQKILHRKKFRGFTNNEKFKFLKLTFHNTYALNQYEKILRKKLLINGLSSKPKKYQLYESNIEPFLRFSHIKDLKSAGWVTIKKDKYKIIRNKMTTCQKEIQAKWGDIQKGKKEHISPLVVMSFDIECDSSHGDFPLAKKNYKKLAQELLDNIHKKLKKEEKPEILENEEMQHDLLNKLIAMSFKDKKNDQEISFCYTKDNKKPSKKEIKLVSEKIAPILFIKLERVANYKELREAVDHTKKIWSNQSIDILKKLAFEMGKKFEINPRRF